MSYSNSEIYGAMLQMIDFFRSGTLPIHELTTRLDVGLTMLSDIDAEWMKAARKKWLVIEEVNAVTLDSPSIKLSSENRKLALQASEELRRMIERIISEKPHTDSSEDQP